jgi:thiazole synthase ThiGH ThiG subunit
MISVGDFVSFAGNYVVEKSEKQEIVMSAISRQGSVIEAGAKFIKVFSENEVCILPNFSNNACIIKKIF